jgi:hypothetical protein
MDRHLSSPPGIGTTCPFHTAQREPVQRKAAKTRSGEAAIAKDGRNRSAAGIAGRGKIDPAAAVTEFRVTIILVGSPDRLIEKMCHRPHLGQEHLLAAPDLAEIAAPHQDALRDILPIHPPDLDRRVVPAAVENVRLGDPVRAQRAFRILPVDREIGTGADFGGSKTGVGFIGSACDH